MADFSADTTSLVALVVSLVALIVSLLQMIQQYASTAYDYRRCSKRVLGQWAQRTRRHFIFSEVRFEVTFSTPHLSIFFPNDHHNPLTEKHTHTTTGTQDIRVPLTPQQFIFEPERGVFSPWSGSTHKEISQYNIRDRPWFLNLQDSTVPEARCAWLDVLAAATASDLGLYVKERRWSYDYMPATLTRPIASADRASFLSLMTLWRVSWRGKGVDGVFAGSGPHCEVRVNDIQGFGAVYTVETKSDTSTTSQCFSNAARRAMFNEFDIGFGKVHTDADIGSSLKKAFLGLNTDFVETIQSWHDDDEWCVGVGLLIACWCIEPSMPKIIIGDTFSSVYSAHTLTSAVAGIRTMELLCGAEFVQAQRKELPVMQRFLPWLAALYKEVDRELITPHLLQAVALSDEIDYVHHSGISWTTSEACLHAIRMLDDHFADVMRQLTLQGSDDDLQRTIAHHQLHRAMAEYETAERFAEEGGTTWVKVLDVAIASDAIAVVDDLVKEYGSWGEEREEVLQKIVVNRLVRGALWMVHNSNAPSKQNDRTGFECVLSHRILSDKTTVYLA
ncbi:hypothetical protein BD626DRAFT_211447 [Schizophyllum amplum]|uniref:Uncharacterized protein n=1 Tax=Schizophyllum amplum TaxID=97359 RepID=A0A550BY37_9AGAR|nr:hypothetical protein BD626DRAFT_211447 [Auriculariopsis ampla]